MRRFRWVVALGSLPVIGCGASPETGTSRVADDASVATGGSSSSASSGSGGTRDSTGGSSMDADAGICSGESVSHVVETPSPAAPTPIGTGGASAADGADAARRLSGLPTDPCGNHGARDCQTAPRAIFGCPKVQGPNGSSTIHPGERIVVTVPITDLGLTSYSCEGLDADQPLTGASELLYGVKPGYVELSGVLPSSTKSGTVIHFSAEASGTGYTPASGSACSNDLTRIDFDVTVE